MNFGSLFAGMTCAWQVDNDDKCQSVLDCHWPDVTRYGDVRNVGKQNLKAVDLICGGFPCQDLSVAGKRQGLAGERSGLWFEFARVIGELKPRWVVVENVPGPLSSGERRDMGILLGQLAKFGYMGAYRVLDAQFFGVAQRRRRVFVVGYLGDGRATEVLFEREGGAWHPAPGREAREEPAYALAASVRGTGDGHGQGWNTTYITGFDRTRGTDSGRVAGPLRSCGARSEGVSDGKADAQYVAYQCHGGDVGRMGALRKGRGDVQSGVPFITNTFNGYTGGADGNDAQAGHIVAIAWQQGVSPDDRSYPVRAGDYAGSLSGTRHDAVAGALGVRCLTPTECERLQGFPDGWTAIDGMSDTARYRMLGNAVAVPVAEWIGRRIVGLSA